MKLEQAIQRCFDRCNLAGEDVDIYKYMYQYKAIHRISIDGDTMVFELDTSYELF